MYRPHRGMLMGMKWIVKLAGPEAEQGLAWARQFFDRYDTSTLQSLRIDRGSARYEGVYGCCHLPTKKQPTFRLSCHLPGPFPCDIVTRKPPLYPRPDGTFGRAPKGCRRTIQCYDPRTGRTWYRLRSKTRVQSIDEGLLWIVTHEAFHFLRRTRQVPSRDNEIEADRFADEQLEAFRARHDQPVQHPLRRAVVQLLMPWTG